jgi:DNA-binding GntR family transcriptional regulator
VPTRRQRDNLDLVAVDPGFAVIGVGASIQGRRRFSAASQLADEHGVARGTVRSALGLLLEEGLVEIVPGIGRRIAGDADRTEPTTAYERVAADLAERVRTGEFGPRVLLPSEATLMERYGVSRNTARRAYRLLADSGLVVIRHGAGAFVRCGSCSVRSMAPAVMETASPDSHAGDHACQQNEGQARD